MSVEQMRIHRFGAVFLLALCWSIAPAALRGQGEASEAGPRTPWGRPDLQGVWTTATGTPLERPEIHAGKPTLSPREAAELMTRAAERIERADQAPRPGTVGGYNQVWLDPGLALVPDLRTSLIVDPEDGRIPWIASEGELSARERARYGVGPYDSYLDLDTGERCITDGVTMAPLQPYNMNFQILQTPDHVAIVHEMYNDYRIIPVADSSDGGPSVAQWLGRARGRWEGDTLVIETRGFADKRHYHWAWPWRASRSSLRVTEWLTRLDSETIDYRFTIDDPTMFTRPWTVVAPMTTDQASRGVTAGPLFEYACHEGNHALPNVLRGARASEQREGKGE